MRKLIVIPARYASSRLPGKPLLRETGKYMVEHVYERAWQSKLADRVIVATDDDRIEQACRSFGAEVVRTREDHASGTDRVAEVAESRNFDLILNLQGDEPLIEPALIDAVADELTQRPDCVMSTAAHAIDQMDDFLNPNVVKVVLDRQNTALYFSRAPIAWWRDGMADAAQRHTLPSPAPLRHIGVYGYRAGFLRQFPALSVAPLEQTESLEQLRVLWHGQRIAVHLSAQAPGAGVDTPEDLARVRALLSPG